MGPIKSVVAFGDSLTWRFEAGTWLRLPYDMRWPNVLAVYSDFRGRRLGSALLTRAEEIARQAGCRAVSLIWAEQNL